MSLNKNNNIKDFFEYKIKYYYLLRQKSYIFYSKGEVKHKLMQILLYPLFKISLESQPSLIIL